MLKSQHRRMRPSREIIGRAAYDPVEGSGTLLKDGERPNEVSDSTVTQWVEAGLWPVVAGSSPVRRAFL